ncbi:hypothetical protein [Bythopirellula polymerisocia]|uniref:Uncharacterized protein n=1 Tax=Bythopirellula polymerisocia TaxID=2528003 RepID=A0A5C6D2Q1_9BACT|nr:hypothetical protein [Bythopirellula polymerisocia]TWU30134.1 hypothetical protein Pla144_09200 [Bythopirellula polymerisocia]
MALVLQILLAIVLILGLVSVFLSAKNWHWSQFVLILFIMLTSVGFLFLAAETMRIHRGLRAKLPGMEEQLARLEQQNAALLRGIEDDAGIIQLEHRLQMITRERGRAWRQVAPTGGLDQQGRIEVAIPNPKPHGLDAVTIVYLFESGNANPGSPSDGRQYLGEFKVVESRDTGVVLEPMQLLDQRTGERLARSEGPWSLYEAMPSDQYKTFAGMDEAELRKRLPASIVEEYLRHRTPATPDDDPRDVIGFDENDVRLGPNEMGKAVKKLYNRPLQDYSYLFSELSRQKAVMLAKRDALIEDNAKWTAALASAEKLTEFRENEIKLLQEDLAGMKRDREAIQKHLKDVNLSLKNARDLIASLLAENSSLAIQLGTRVQELQDIINGTVPAAAAIAVP